MDFGSGSTLLGGTEALKAAFMSRGVDPTSILAQQSPASAGFNPNAVPALPVQGQPLPNAPAPTGGLQPATMGAMGTVSSAPPMSEAELIIKALSERLRSISSIEKGGQGGNGMV